MNCPYCEENLAAPPGEGMRMGRCGICLRPILFTRDHGMLKLSESGAVPVFFLGLVLTALAMQLVVLAYVLSGMNILGVMGIAVAMIVLGLLFGHDGYLAVRTRIDRTRGSLSRGLEAVSTGWVKMVTAVILFAMALGTGTGAVIRELTGRWPF